MQRYGAYNCVPKPNSKEPPKNPILTYNDSKIRLIERSSANSYSSSKSDPRDPFSRSSNVTQLLTTETPPHRKDRHATWLFFHIPENGSSRDGELEMGNPHALVGLLVLKAVEDESGVWLSFAN